MCSNNGLTECDAPIIWRELAVDKDLESLGFKGFNRPLEKELVLPDASAQGNRVNLIFSTDGLADFGQKSHEAVMESGRDIG